MNLYVDPSIGNDATTRTNNTPLAPWATLGRAVWGSTTRTSPNTTECAQPGDTVIIAGGTYTTSQWSGESASALTYNPAVTGTAGNPITFRAATRGGVTLAWTTNVGSKGNMIGAVSRDHIIWDGFFIDEANAHPAGWCCYFQDSENCEFHYCEVKGDLTNTDDLDNHAGFRLETSLGSVIKNCEAYDIINTTEGGPENGCGLELYTSGGYTIEHCEFHDCGTGLFIKAPYDGATSAFLTSAVIRYNLCYDNSEYNLSVHRSPLTGSNRLLVHQNILRGGSGAGYQLMSFDGDGPGNTKFVNNLIYLPGLFEAVWTGNGSTWIADAGNEFKNNIVIASSTPMLQSNHLDAQWTTAKFLPDRNCYNGHAATFATTGTGSKTFSQWQALGSNGYDQNSSTATITFASPGTDFHLVDNEQAALTIGRVVFSIGGTDGATIPAGPYISGDEVIGIESEEIVVAVRHRRRPGGGL